MEKPILCLNCREVFSDEEIVSAKACPGCGSQSIPADVRQSHSLTLSDHEWRILFIWAQHWAKRCIPGPEGVKVIEGIAAEAKLQEPTLPSLSLMEDVQALVQTLGDKAVFHDGSA